MRELKYRIYDKTEKCYSDKAFSIDQLGICYVQDEDGYWEEIDEERYIIEQYTGLKDKNGKEVYEGDVVRDGKGEKCRVEWSESEAHFGLYAGEQMELTDFIWMRGEDVEVIGKVHENSELLKGE